MSQLNRNRDDAYTGELNAREKEAEIESRKKLRKEQRQLEQFAHGVNTIKSNECIHLKI